MLHRVQAGEEDLWALYRGGEVGHGDGGGREGDRAGGHEGLRAVHEEVHDRRVHVPKVAGMARHGDLEDLVEAILCGREDHVFYHDEAWDQKDPRNGHLRKD